MAEIYLATAIQVGAMKYKSKAEQVSESLQAGASVDEVRSKLDPDRHAKVLSQRARNSAMGYRLYVIPAGEFVKVGITSNIDLRWKTLRTANPAIEKPAFLSEPLSTPHDIERAVHGRLIGYRIEGTEWFRCARAVALEVVHSVLGV